MVLDGPGNPSTISALSAGKPVKTVVEDTNGPKDARSQGPRRLDHWPGPPESALQLSPEPPPTRPATRRPPEYRRRDIVHVLALRCRPASLDRKGPCSACASTATDSRRSPRCPTGWHATITHAVRSAFVYISRQPVCDFAAQSGSSAAAGRPRRSDAGAISHDRQSSGVLGPLHQPASENENPAWYR